VRQNEHNKRRSIQMSKLWEANGVMGNSKWEEVCRPQTQTDGQGIIYRGRNDPRIVAQAQEFAKEWKDKTKVIICEPTIGNINYLCHEATVDFVKHCKEYEQRSEYKFFKTTLGRLMIAYAREKFAEFAVDGGFDYIIFMDDDHIVPSDLFERLQSHLDKYDIVAPLCLQRSPPHNPVIYKEGERIIQGIKYRENNFHTKWHKGDLVTDADAIGFGFAIIKVDLFKRVPKPWFFFMDPVGEDIAFCMKAKPHGCKILVDTSVESPHLGDPPIITWSDYEREKDRD